MLDTTIPRPEYPRPQFVRSRWQNLNGEWEFEIDSEDTGLQRGLDRPFDRTITVPFCPESQLSGIGEEGFMDVVWYRRTIQVPSDWRGQRILVHFGAVDHDATVWVNGREVARHRGGFTSFQVDISEALNGGDQFEMVVRARDTRTEPQARGKQATWLENSACHYTRTTGIWQTVWMEPVGDSHMARPAIVPDVPGQRFTVAVPMVRARRGQRLAVTVLDEHGEVASTQVGIEAMMTPTLSVELPSERVRFWSPTDPHLYDVRIELVDADGSVLDSFASYAGLRSIRIEGRRVLINEEEIFQRLVLDQGYYPDGIMTAPTDEALIRDIELARAAGFNGARLHQKVFEERFLYHADRLGYLLWAEFGDWGAHTQGVGPEAQQPTPTFITQWLESIERDRSHPAIIGWCGLNETFATRDDTIVDLDDVTRGMFLAAKLVDPTRPVIDASGYSHRVSETDIYDSHSYEQDPIKFGELMAGLSAGMPYENRGRNGETFSVPYAGQPYFCSEFGGILWVPEHATESPSAEGWGYGQAVGSEEEFYARLEGLCRVLMDDDQMFGFCYTQLTDVFQEKNGIYQFDRTPKLDMDRIRQIFGGTTAYERH